MLIKKNFFYSIVLVHASSVRTRDWTRTCSWTLNRTRTEPIDKVRVRFEFKYYRFGFGSSSSIMGSGSVRVRKTARWAGSSSGSSSRFNELEPDRTEPRNTNYLYLKIVNMKLIYIRSTMEPKNYSTIRSILKKEQGEKITPYIFKINERSLSKKRRN